MLHREIIAVCSEIRTEHTNTLRGRLSALCRRDLVLKMAVRMAATWLQRVKGLTVAEICRRLTEIVWQRYAGGLPKLSPSFLFAV